MNLFTAHCWEDLWRLMAHLRRLMFTKSLNLKACYFFAAKRPVYHWQCLFCFLFFLPALNFRSYYKAMEIKATSGRAHCMHYFLIRFAQTKITFIFWNNWVIKENESFLLVEPCSLVTCCVQIQLQYFFRKYIFICTIYTLIMQLISVIFYDTC